MPRFECLMFKAPGLRNGERSHPHKVVVRDYLVMSGIRFALVSCTPDCVALERRDYTCYYTGAYVPLGTLTIERSSL